MLKITKEEFYNKLHDILKSRGAAVGDRKDFQYFIQFVARASGGECMVKIFQGKKGTHAQILNSVGGCENVVRAAVEEMMGALPFSAGEKKTIAAPAGHAITRPMIGTDESGKGDFFGPLVVAAVYVSPAEAAALAAAGVRDCKTMSDSAALARAEHIQRAAPHAIVTLKPEEYNSLYEETGNLNRLLASCHARVIKDILGKVDCDYVLIDQFGDKRLVEQALMENGGLVTRASVTLASVTLEQRPRAEDNIAVAAASVVARARFLEAMRDLSHEYGADFPKGASAQVDAAARAFVRDFGGENLRRVAKLHFKNARRL